MTPTQEPSKYFEDRLRLYVKEHLLPGLDLGNPKFGIEITNRGCHSLIIYLQVEGVKPLIIRGVRKRYKLERIVRNCRYLSQHGFNVPEVLYVDDSAKTYREFGHYIVVEERIEGRSLNEFADLTDFLPLIAQTFAQLHSIDTDRWGMIGSEKKLGFFRYINKKAQNELTQLVHRYKDFLAAKEKKAYSAWFKDNRLMINSSHSFSLCHGDPYLTNILITKDRQLYLLDNDHTKYYPMAIEFFKFGFVLNQDDPEKMAIWQGLYFQRLSERMQEEFQRSKNFYLAFVLLHITFELLKDNWRRERPYTFSPVRAKHLFRQCIEG